MVRPKMIKFGQELENMVLKSKYSKMEVRSVQSGGGKGFRPNAGCPVEIFPSIISGQRGLNFVGKCPKYLHLRCLFHKSSAKLQFFLHKRVGFNENKAKSNFRPNSRMIHPKLHVKIYFRLMLYPSRLTLLLL